MSRKRICSIILSIILLSCSLFTMIACDGENEDVHKHSYSIEINNATCTVNGEKIYTCDLCGHIYSEVIVAVGHQWNDSICATECLICGALKDNTSGHKWIAATCYVPKTCSVCGATEGVALSHKWNEATCAEPKTCSNCGETEGEALGHKWSESATCKVCQQEMTPDDFMSNISLRLYIFHIGASNNTYCRYYMTNNFEEIYITMESSWRANGYILTGYVQPIAPKTKVYHDGTPYSSSDKNMYFDKDSEAWTRIYLGKQNTGEFFTVFFNINGITSCTKGYVSYN